MTKQFDKIIAAFEPIRRDDLRPGVDAWIGRATEWQAYWIIEDGQYAGDWAMVANGDRDFVGWVPSRDLRPVSVAQEKS